MTDAVLRFLVELDDRGLTTLTGRLKAVAKTSTTTAATVTAAGAAQTRAVERVVAAEASARQRSVQNAAARHAALRRQVDDYQAIARAAVKGSDEQVAADLLAQKAAQRLARETAIAAGETSIAYRGVGSSARHAERDIDRSARGALAASGIFRGLGRSVAFASSWFLGGAGIVFGLRSVYNETSKGEVVQKSFEAQLDSNGISLRKYGKEIDGVIDREAALAGVDRRDVKSAFTEEIRTTGSVGAAEKLIGDALDLSAGKHISLSQAVAVESRVFAGNLGILKRYGITLTNIKTPLQGLIALHNRFKGQAGIDTEASAFGRAQSSLHTFEEGLGHGMLPVLADELNKLTGALNDEQLMHGAEKLGNSIATNVGGAIETIVRDVHDNWPEIKQDFDGVAGVARDIGSFLKTVSHWLHDIASITPGNKSVLGLLLETLLISKGASKLAGLAGKGAGTGAVDAIGKTAVEAGTAGAVASRFGKTGPIFAVLLIDSQLPKTKGPPGSWSHPENGAPAFIRGVPLLGKAAEYGTSLGDKISNLLGLKSSSHHGEDPVGKIVDDAAKAYKHAGDVAAQSWDAVAKAIRATGGDLDRQKGKLEEIVKSEQAAARASAQLLEQAFTRATANIDDAFNAQTQQMLDDISYRVTVVGKNLHEAFTLRGDEKTPAERELDALNKLGQRRTFKRDIMDATKNLAEARAVGDPEQIRKAQQALEDAETEKRRYGLEQRATLERAAADKAKAQAQKELQARRNLEQQHLDDAIAAIAKRAEKGKLAGGKAVQAILAELAKYGLNFKTTGALLGAAFSTELDQNLDLVRTRADNVKTAFDRIGATKRKIKELADEVARLAAQLARIQKGPPGTDKKGASKLPTSKGIFWVNGYPVGYDTGGVAPGSGRGDTVPAMLTPGELVLNERDQLGLAARLGRPGLKGRALFGLIQRFAGGGVVDDLLHILARNSRNVDAKGAHPIGIEGLVNHSRAGSWSRDARLGLMEKLAQAQAHPVRAGFFTPHPDEPSTLGQHPHLLGGAGFGGATFTGDITIVLEDRRNARENAKAIRQEFQKMGRANAESRRGPFAGKRIVD